MKEKEFWILLYKKFLNWEWYDHPPTKAIFIHCLLNANWTDESWRGQPIKRGQFPTSVEKLATTNGLTTQQTRTALSNLQSTNEIEIRTTNRYSIITVKNWDAYQPKQQTKNKGKQQTNNKVSNKQIGGSNNNTINNIYKDTNNIYNISLSNKEKISENEREILTNYVKRKKLAKSSVRAYVNAMIKNGDHIDILKEEKSRIENLETQKKLQAESVPPPEIEKPSPEDEKKGLELLRNTVKQIRRRK